MSSDLQRARGTYDRCAVIIAAAGAALLCVAALVRLAGAGGEPSERTASPWREVFFDDFDGSTLNTAAWSAYKGHRLGIIGRRDPGQLVVAGGELEVRAEGNVAGGLAHRQNLLYGKWEVRARVDRGQGYGPAILLWPQSDAWPEDGEIDISEIPRGDRRRSHFTVHWGAENRQASAANGGDFTHWHVFGCEWRPGGIRYLLDGEPQWELRSPAAAIPAKPMHLALQLDVGGSGRWIPPRDPTTPQPVALHVDWVRVSRPA